MKTYTATEAQFSQIFSELENNTEIGIRFKKKEGVLLSLKDYEALLETIYVLSDPCIQHQLQNYDAIEKTEFTSLESLKHAMEI
jgi:PHD/YefM family antitoxin component YafN of YafNO toxin-antitoxin module